MENKIARKDNINNYKFLKFAQLIVAVAIDLFFFIYLFTNKNLLTNIYKNNSLLFLYITIEVIMIIILISLLIDFISIRKLFLTNHSLNQQVYLDSLTKVPNRHSLDLYLDMYRSSESLTNSICAMFSIVNLPYINKHLGRETGNELLTNFSILLESHVTDNGFVGRNGGNEFIFFSNNYSLDMYSELKKALVNDISTYNKQHPEIPLDIKAEYLLNSEEKLGTLEDMLSTLSQRFRK